MTTLEQISHVLILYTEAVKKADRAALAELCTEKMLRQFGLRFRCAVFIAGLLFPRRLRELQPEDITLEDCSDSRAVVSYSVHSGRRRRYERVVVLKHDGNWKIDGKYA
jgi:hypothetical protein